MRTENFSIDGVSFTLNEMRIIALHCRALVQRDMSKVLGNSPGTVRNQVATIYNKLNVHKCTELVAWAMHVGFTPDGLFEGRDLFADSGPVEQGRD